MKEHLFIFSSGKWLGEGTIHLNLVKEDLRFFTRWKMEEPDKEIECIQEIQIKGLSDIMVNRFVFSDISAETFSVFMENHAVGKVVGKGFIKPSMLGWEFRVPETGFEGFEFYEKQPNGMYHVHGEFSTQEDLRTVIHGKLWRQSVEG